ncbi:galactose mutarotase [bacterium]|nr:galactose mutarotase [bacterium]
MKYVLIGLLAAAVVASVICGCGKDVSIHRRTWGKTAEGGNVYTFTLTSKAGVECVVTNYGGYITSLRVPDRTGAAGDVVLGYETLQEYFDDEQYLGCLIGRFGNRIAQGTFRLNGEAYSLAVNNGKNHLHGGIKGFHKVLWDAETFGTAEEAGVRMSYFSPDGEEGYPGNLTVTAVFSLTAAGDLKVDFSARTDEATPVNLTHHGYFNLTCAKRDILGHELQIDGDYYLPVDEGLIPLGNLEPVEGTPFDFRKAKAIGRDIDADDRQLEYGLGYDHNWVLNGESGVLKRACSVYEPESGRVMDIFTTDPGLQFYSGNFLDGSTTGKKGILYEHRYAIALEPQHYPDSPNQPGFPSTILKPGETYRHTIVYRFSVR